MLMWQKNPSLFLSFLEVTWIMKMMGFSNNLVKNFPVETMSTGLLCCADNSKHNLMATGHQNGTDTAMLSSLDCIRE